jgi:hypothetical protein
MEPDGFLPPSQDHANGPYSEPAEFTLHRHGLLLSDLI